MASARALPVERTAGTAQGVVLLLVAVFPIMGSTLIAPILPRMQEHFAATPGVEILTRIVLVVPALCIALFSPIFGTLADRHGRRGLLLAASVLYALCGVAPLFLDSLGSIVASRVGVGIAEAVLMTCSTALIGDFFVGPARSKWLAAQTAIASFSAAVFAVIGGILGNSNWRLAFILYAASLIIFGLLLVTTWEPVRSETTVDKSRFPWRRILGICGVTLFGAFVFYIVPIQMAFLLNGVGTHAPATIGIASACGALAVIAGTLVYRRLTATSPIVLITFALFVAGVGLLGIAHATDFRSVVLFALVNQLGCGLLLPTLLNWALDGLPFDLRGRGTGAFMMSFFLGQFISPIAIVILSGVAGGLFVVTGAIGIAAIVFALVFGVTRGRWRAAVAT